MNTTEHRQTPSRDRVEAELEEMLSEAEEVASRVRSELREYRAERAAGTVDLDAQHAEIDRLAEHLAQTRIRWSEVREFFEQAVKDLFRGQATDQEQHHA